VCAQLEKERVRLETEQRAIEQLRTQAAQTQAELKAQSDAQYEREIQRLQTEWAAEMKRREEERAEEERVKQEELKKVRSRRWAGPACGLHLTLCVLRSAMSPSWRRPRRSWRSRTRT
jgi:hypothetical protein